MNNADAQRTHFSVSTSTDFTTVKGLTSSTGQSSYRFGSVIVKELIDNALDACETAGIAPQITIGYEHDGTFAIWCIADNGNGLSKDTIEKILDFTTRTSDKATYKSPSRGAQGNAFKTILGIPCALGEGYVMIESQGFRHRIKINATESMLLPTDYDVSDIPLVQGTAVKVVMKTARSTEGLYWAQAFAVFNPHIRVKIGYVENLKMTMLTFDSEISETAIFYPIQPDFKKISPADPTNAHSYTDADFNALTCITGSQTKKTIYEFARSFKGTSAKVKAQKITSTIAGKFVADIYTNREVVTALHTAIKLESTPTQHKELGLIGKDNLLARFQNVGRYWYQKESGDIYGFPFIFEILIAESYDNQATYFFGINHSPTYSDFLSGVFLATDKMRGHGIDGLLREVIDSENHVVVCHLVCPNLNFKDKGKSSLEIPNTVAKLVAAAIGKAAKTIQRELKKNVSAYDKELREIRRRQQSEEVTMKDAVSNVLADAISKATSDGKYPANVRALYYKVREFVQQHTPQELTYSYFSQDLLIEYWRNNGRNPKIYNDPRGVLHHPHESFQLPLGTFEVDRYKFPEYQYNKILYIEKKGLCHPLQAAQLLKKYDMALIGGEGYPCEAVRILLDRAQTGENYIIFVLHDADPDGYNIARTLREETVRMPNHNITVIDLGLTIQSGLDMKLEGENKKRRKELPSTLKLTDDERAFFQGDLIERPDDKKEWLGKIIELNAMSSDQFIQYVDTGISRALDELKLPYKIVPPEETLEIEAAGIRTDKLKALAKDRILEELDIDDMVEQLVDSIEFDAQTFTGEVREYLLEHEFQTWRKGLDVITDNQLSANESVFDEKVAALIANL